MVSTRALGRASSAALLALVMVSCGDSDPETAPAADPTESMGPMDDHGDGEGMDGHLMNDPDATPADQVEGEVSAATFTLLDTAPPGSDDVAGQAWLAQNDDGTTVTLRLTGLEAGREYVAHLHAQACAEDDGGPHFAFDPEGEEVPPNEVHLAFTASPDGDGEATVTNDRRVGEDAPSVVVHPADAEDNRMACADF